MPSLAPRAIVVGAGLMGRWHAEAVRRAGFGVAAVVDADAARARALSARHAGALASRTLAEALAGAARAGDVVHVCTPLESHVALATEALDAGCHVIVEKPVAASAAEVAALVSRAERSGRLLVPVHQYLFQEGVARAARWLPAVGPVLHVDLVTCTAGSEGRSDAAHDRLVGEVLPHPLSLLARLVDPAVDEVAWSVVRPRVGELRVSGVLAGASVGIVVSTHGRPTRNALTLVCARGTITLDLFHGFAIRVVGSTSRAFKIAHPFMAAAHTLTAAAVNLGARALRGDAAYPGLRELVRRAYVAASGSPDGGTGTAPVNTRETLAVARALDVITAAVPTGATHVAVPAPSATAAAMAPPSGGVGQTG